SVGRWIKKATFATGRWIKKSTFATGRWIKKATFAIGRWIKKATFAIGRWFKKTALSIANFFVQLFTHPKPMFKRLLNSSTFSSFSSSAIAVVIGLLFGLILMLVTKPQDAFEGFWRILLGGFNNPDIMRGIGDMLYVATPLLLTGLSVGFAFKTGLFNIGASGQYTMGMYFALVAAFTLEGNWVVCLLAGIIGGALWGFIPGLFKAVFNVNEVITSIMTNYIGVYFVDMMIKNDTTMFMSIEQRTYPVPLNAAMPTFGLDKLFNGSRVALGLILAISTAIILYYVLNKTKFGFELRACGLNKNAARYAGVNEKRSIILSMVIAGALAGLAGAINIQTGGNPYSPKNVIAPMGFNGIPVALLGVSHPIGIIFSALFIAHLQRGGFFLQLLDFKPEIIDIIVGIIIYFSAAALIIKSYLPKLIAKFRKKKVTEPAVENEQDNNVDISQEVVDPASQEIIDTASQEVVDSASQVAKNSASQNESNTDEEK
ncbi:MAG: ABC transporter permease, partial [Clostridia bacterium]